MDLDEGRRYIEPVKDEVVRGWDHSYNIYEDYFHPTDGKELGWCNASSASSNSDDVLEKWKNHMHKVSVRKCGLITQLLCHVVT